MAFSQESPKSKFNTVPFKIFKTLCRCNKLSLHTLTRNYKLQREREITVCKEKGSQKFLINQKHKCNVHLLHAGRFLFTASKNIWLMAFHWKVSEALSVRNDTSRRNWDMQCILQNGFLSYLDFRNEEERELFSGDNS